MHSPLAIGARDPRSRARAGILRTAHAEIPTPVFMPVGTQATVKGVTPRQVAELGARIVLANTYHLLLRPGPDVVAELGGIQKFMGWDGAVLTDSGGYQVMSLAALRKVTDEGVEFRSHLDGSLVKLTPESVIAAQATMGVDIAMVLDECVAAGADRATSERAMRRTTAWAERSRRIELPPGRWMFGIVQGGMYPDLRRQHAGELARLEFSGYAVGGLSVGEERGRTLEVAAETAAELPEQRPRYLMGVGLPQDLLHFIGMGFDMFDCVLPTRNGRNGSVFTHDGRLNLRLARHARDAAPLDAECGCYVCSRFSRAYLRHLMTAGEMLGAQLATLHNLHYFLDLMAQARARIAAGDYAAWARARAERMDAGERDGAGRA